MAFLGIGAAKHTSFVLIDIDSASIGGAVMYTPIKTPPVVSYASRLKIEKRGEEELVTAMGRTLQELLQELIIKGAPLLRQQSGSGHVDKILVRIGTPWQKTLIRRERVEENKPFTYTNALQRDILRKKETAPQGYQNFEESVIATLLNGYETEKPFGKQAKQVELVVASSWIEHAAAAEIQKFVRHAYHTHSLTFITPASVTYEVFHQLFPHEKNYLSLEISGESTDMSYTKNGILVKSSSLSLGFNDIIRHARDGVRAAPHAEPRNGLIDPTGNQKFASSVEAAENSWLSKVEELFKEFASEHALPRTIFLVAPSEAREYLARLLDTESLRSLWLSDEPLRVVSVATSHLVPFLSFGTEADQDTVLGLFTLFASTTIHTALPKA